MIGKGILCMLCLVGVASGQDFVPTNAAALVSDAAMLAPEIVPLVTEAATRAADVLPLVTEAATRAPDAVLLSTNAVSVSTNVVDASTNNVAVPPGQTIITSDRMEYDYPRTLAVLTGNVLVRTTDMKMWADEMTVILTPEDDIESATAIGRVRIFQPGRKARCRKAIFLVDQNEVILTGDAVIEQGRDRIEGRVIHIWTDTDHMVSEPGHLVVFSEDAALPGAPSVKEKPGKKKKGTDAASAGTTSSDATRSTGNGEAAATR